jgi:3-hydroxyisobutyrate dehydrogenase-like beta-hydroxyacid dehydrogenase
VVITAGAIKRIALIGFGEVGGIFGEDLAACGAHVAVFDKLVYDSSARNNVFAKALRAQVNVKESIEQVIAGAQIVLSATTASSALDVAKEAARYLSPGQVYVDLNSVSPETKQKVSAEIRKSEADFVEAAVMAAVKPTRLKTPILVGGPRATEVAAELRLLGMDATAVSDRIGVASAIKMCRSVVMKGLAALAIESLFAARRYGAEDAVIASFEKTYPGMGWANGLPDALTRRAVEHSRRREAEMREVVDTLKAAGMIYGMSSSTADLQHWLTAELEARNLAFRPEEPISWRAVADAIGSPASTDKA